MAIWKFLSNFAQFFPPNTKAMGNVSEYKLPLRALAIGTYAYNFHLSKGFFEQMESADVHDADIDVKATVTYNGDVYEIDIRCTGEATLPCDRCLDDMQESIDAEYHIAAKYGEKFDDSDDALIEIPRSDSDLDIAHIIYDTVMLDIPIMHAHAEGQCNPVMSDILGKHIVLDAADAPEQSDTDDSAGATDPRWDALKKLKE